jgi:hypothetical protein
MSQVGTETSIFVDKYDVNTWCLYIFCFFTNQNPQSQLCLSYKHASFHSKYRGHEKNSHVPSKQHVTETWICMHLKMKLLKGKMFNQLDMHTRLGYNDGLLATSNSLLYPPSNICIVYCVYDSCYKIMILLELIGSISLAVSQLLVFGRCFREASHEASVSERSGSLILQVLLYQ